MVTDFDEGADEIADHVVEEAGAGDAVEEQVVMLLPGGVVDGADGGGVLGRLRGVWARVWATVGGSVASGQVRIGGGKGGEVVGAEDVGCGELEQG